MLHLNLSANLKSILDTASDENGHQADEITDAIETQQKLIELFKKRRKDTEKKSIL